MPHAVYRFKAPLERFPGKGGTHYVAVPFSVEERFGTKGNVRIKGTVNGIPMDRALRPRGDGTHYIILSPELRRKAGLRLGTMADISFVQDEAPDEITLPEELVEALDMEPAARDAFEKQTAGIRRSIAYWIDSGKRPETRAARAAEMMRRLLSPQFMIGGKKGK